MAALWNKHNLTTLFDSLWQSTRKLPSYNQCVPLGYGGGTKAFYEVRAGWCILNNVKNVQKQKKPMGASDQKQVDERAEEIRRPLPNGHVPDAPVEVVVLSETRKAVKEYRAAWKHISQPAKPPGA